MPVGPRDRLGGGLVAPYHPAKQGGRRDILGPFRRKRDRKFVSVASRQQLLMRSCLIQHGMQEVNPLIRIRLRQPQELPLHGLNRVLCQLGQHEEPCVGEGASRTRVRGTVTTARTGLAIDRAVLQIGRQRVLERGEQCREFWLGSPRHRLYTPGSLRHLFVRWPRHLRHSMIRREA